MGGTRRGARQGQGGQGPQPVPPQRPRPLCQTPAGIWTLQVWFSQGWCKKDKNRRRRGARCPVRGVPPWQTGLPAARSFQAPGASSAGVCSGSSASVVGAGDRRVTVPCQGSHRSVAPSRPLPSLPFQMDPVQKAVISHTFGVPAPLKKKQFISCNICHLRFNSAVSGAGEHRAGRASGVRGAGASACG